MSIFLYHIMFTITNDEFCLSILLSQDDLFIPVYIRSYDIKILTNEKQFKVVYNEFKEYLNKTNIVIRKDDFLLLYDKLVEYNLPLPNLISIEIIDEPIKLEKYGNKLTTKEILFLIFIDGKDVNDKSLKVWEEENNLNTNYLIQMLLEADYITLNNYYYNLSKAKRSLLLTVVEKYKLDIIGDNTDLINCIKNELTSTQLEKEFFGTHYKLTDAGKKIADEYKRIDDFNKSSYHFVENMRNEEFHLLSLKKPDYNFQAISRLLLSNAKLNLIKFVSLDKIVEEIKNPPTSKVVIDDKHETKTVDKLNNNEQETRTLSYKPPFVDKPITNQLNNVNLEKPIIKITPEHSKENTNYFNKFNKLYGNSMKSKLPQYQSNNTSNNKASEASVNTTFNQKKSDKASEKELSVVNIIEINEKNNEVIKELGNNDCPTVELKKETNTEKHGQISSEKEQSIVNIIEIDDKNNEVVKLGNNIYPSVELKKKTNLEKQEQKSSEKEQSIVNIVEINENNDLSTSENLQTNNNVDTQKNKSEFLKKKYGIFKYPRNDEKNTEESFEDNNNKISGELRMKYGVYHTTPVEKYISKSIKNVLSNNQEVSKLKEDVIHHQLYSDSSNNQQELEKKGKSKPYNQFKNEILKEDVIPNHLHNKFIDNNKGLEYEKKTINHNVNLVEKQLQETSRLLDDVVSLDNLTNDYENEIQTNLSNELVAQDNNLHQVNSDLVIDFEESYRIKDSIKEYEKRKEYYEINKNLPIQSEEIVINNNDKKRPNNKYIIFFTIFVIGLILTYFMVKYYI